MASRALNTGASTRAPKFPADVPEQTPLAILRALPGPMARHYAKLDPSAGRDLERARRLATLFKAFNRDDMECAVDLLLAEMDATDGDPDLEDGGDTQDGCAAEDDFVDHDRNMFGPGCPISDPDISVDDERQGCTTEEPHNYGGDAVDDPDFEDDDAGSRAPHVYRIQMDRCTPRVSSYHNLSTGRLASQLRGYDLIDEPIVPPARKLLSLRFGS